VEQRPAAVAALDGAKVIGDLGLDLAEARRVDLSQEVLQEDIFGRDGGIGLQLEQPMAVRALLRLQSRRHLLDEGVDGIDIWKGSGGEGDSVPVSGCDTAVHLILCRQGLMLWMCDPCRLPSSAGLPRSFARESAEL
jgi:hypothetical protein